MAASPFRLPDTVEVEAMSAEEILGLVTDAFPGKVSLACSFQKEESVLLDMLFAIEPKARVFAIDTHYLFPETYELWRAVESVTRRTSRCSKDRARDELAATHGDDLWEREARSLPRRREGRAAHSGSRRARRLDLGLRRDQSATRANAPKLGWDAAHELWKANPLADWSDDDCWAYIKDRDLPYNALHDRGYASIGRHALTSPVLVARVVGPALDRTECGLHVGGEAA